MNPTTFLVESAKQQPPPAHQYTGKLSSRRITSKQHAYLLALAKKKGLARHELDEMCLSRFRVVLDHVTSADASKLIELFNNKAESPVQAQRPELHEVVDEAKSRQEEIAQLRASPHLSRSQLFLYQSCSLLYKYQYVERRTPERLSLSLPFGKAIHGALEFYYRSRQRGVTEPVGTLEDIFRNQLSKDISTANVPIIFQKETPNLDSAITMGRNMLKTFHAVVDLGENEIAGVEIPLEAMLFSGEAKAPTDYKLVGVIDLLLRDKSGNLTVVDHKTASAQWTSAAVQADLQLTSYSYLLTAGGYASALSDTRCQIDVLRKLKVPKFESIQTIRTPKDRQRFAKIAEGVLAGIDARIFVPNRSWLCGGCGFSKACAAW